MNHRVALDSSVSRIAGRRSAVAPLCLLLTRTQASSLLLRLPAPPAS